MATETVTTSLTIGFDIDADAAGPTSILSTEVDGRETADGGYNEGETNFKPGDNVGIMLFKSSNVTLLPEYQLSTHGSLSSAFASQFSASSEVDTFLVFDSSPEASLSYPYNTSGTFTWMGASLGATTVVNQANIELVVEPTEEYYVGVLRAEYVSTGVGIVLSNTLLSGEDKYEIFCFWVGELTT